MCDNKIEGDVFDMELVAREWLKGGAFFKSSLEMGAFHEFGTNIK
jgi:hypothetical protein